MSNVLDNGTVLPFGLLSGTASQMNDAFKKTYQNTSLRVGIVIKSYGKNDPNNVSPLFATYDVMAIEQNEDQGSSPITYKHCLAASGFGSIADFFEASLRNLQQKTTKGPTPTFSGQNGAIVLVLCLNGMSETGVIIGSLAHPDRPTTLLDGSPHLEGEYNGIHFVINADGSTTFTFKGATDNNGKVIDASQGNTIIQVQTDGSFQVNHSTITFNLAKSGVATLNAKSDINLITNTNLNVTTTKDANINCVNSNVNASGKAVINASEIDLNGSTGAVLTDQTDPVIDLITGAPTMGVQNVKAGQT